MVIHMLYAKVKKADAERLKRLLVRMSLLDNQSQTEHSSSYVYFPVLNEDGKIKKLIDGQGAVLVVRRASSHTRKTASFASMAARLRKNGLLKASGGYDVIGDIAIIDVDGKAERDRLARALIAENSHIKVVLAKRGPVSGKYRVRKLVYVLGEKRYTTTHHENGCSFFMDVRKTFFSPRLAYERSRIVSLVRPKDKVIVMFAGAGPFVVEIAKLHRDSHVVGIELNPDSFAYMAYNIKANKLNNAEALLGDAGRVLSKYKGYADRILMPLPMDSMQFMPSAIKMAKKRATIHLYTFCSSKDAGAEVEKRLGEIAREHSVTISKINKRVVRPYSAKESEMVFDIMLKKRSGIRHRL